VAPMLAGKPGRASPARGRAMTQGDPQEAAGVREGQILAGKYRVERVLGVGGMGVVVAAHHVQLDEKVAIKFLLPAMLHNQDVVGRFAREARAAVKIKSEHVARVSDVGTLENGAPYMVMEYLDGGDLAGWLQKAGPLPLEQAVDFVLQACVGVASAHGIGIVHRDLKPANLFCLRGNDGQFVIKVLDFGISKVTSLSGSEAGGGMTQTTAVMGSPYYMSPEQMQSAKEVDARTDIWSLGIVVYELLTGSTPFVGESFTDIAIKVATASFAPLRTFRPDAQPGLEAVISKCLEKDKRRRYGNVAELALALTDFGSKRSRPSIERIVGIIQASGLSTSALALPPSPVVARTPTPPTKVSKRSETLLEPESGDYGALGTMAPSANTAPGVPGRGKTRAVVGGAGLLAVAAVIGVVAWARHQPNTASVSTATSVPSATAASVASTTPSAPEPAKPIEASEPVLAASQIRTVPPVPLPPVQTPAVTPTRIDTKKSAGAKSLPATSPIAPAAPAAAPPSQPRPKPNCSPPYVIDSAGDRQYKPECL
jgi:eukaryotic-like serine/threonine-protein kinase